MRNFNLNLTVEQHSLLLDMFTTIADLDLYDVNDDPETFQTFDSLWDAVIAEDWNTGKDLHEKLMPLWDAIGLDNMPSLCKYAQKLQGLESGFARRPTSPATDNQKEKVSEALINLNLIK